MSLEQRVNDDIKAAMRAKNKDALRSLRAIKSALLLAKTEKGATETLDEAGEIKLLAKMLKQRKDSIEMFMTQGREDLAEKEQAEIASIVQYLPKQLSEEDLKAGIMAVIEKTGASSMRDMGKVMGLASKQFAGKADGKLISTLVKQLLQS